LRVRLADHIALEAMAGLEVDQVQVIGREKLALEFTG